MPTIKDIARAAGVSHGTVSNVLNKTGKVSAKKIRLVEEAAKQLGYVPNAQAQLLRQGTVRLVAVIVPTLSDRRYLSLFLAVKNCMLAHEYEVTVHTTDDIAGKEEQVLRRLPLSNLAAVVTVSSLKQRAAQAYAPLPCPVVTVNRPLMLENAKKTEAAFDHYQGGVDIGRYILRHGWKSVAFFCASGRQPDDSAIFAGLSDALENGAVAVEKFSSDTDLVMNKAFDMMMEHRGFDCIVAVGGLRAEAIAVAGKALYAKQVPELICIDTSQTFSSPFYHTYEMDYGQMGAQISAALVAHLREGQPLAGRIAPRAKGFSFTFPHVKKGAERTLSLLTLESPTMCALEKLVPMLHALTGITLKITCMPYTDLYAHLDLINDRFYYDLVRMDTAWLASVGTRVYLPLEETGVAGDILARGLVSPMHSNYYRAGGVLCALPFDPSVQILLYRTDLFQDATLCRLYYEKYRETLAVPETIDQHLRVAGFFTRGLNPDSPTQFGTTMTTGTAVTAACDFLPYYLAGGGEVCDGQGVVRLDTPQMQDALATYLKMKRYTPTEESLWWRDAVRQFADGSTASVLTFSNHASYLLNSKRSHVVGKTGVAVIPGKRPLLGGGVIGICRHSPSARVCGEFLNWFYTKDIASAIIRLGGTSPLTDVFDSHENFSVFPWQSVEKESFAIGTRGNECDATPGFSNKHYEYVLGTAVRKMIHSAISPEEAARFAQALYDGKEHEEME